MLTLIKQKIMNWLLKDIQIDELIARRIKTVGNTLYTDVISERTTGAGVTIDGALIKDGLVDLAAIPTPLTGKDADTVDGYHASDLLASPLRKTESEWATDFDNYGDADIAASYMDNVLNTTVLQSIIDNTNLTIQKGQEIVDVMVDPSRIGTGGRRGLMGDDWDDNKYSSRDKAAAVATSLDRIFQSFRPEWTVEDRTWSAANGYLEHTTLPGSSPYPAIIASIPTTTQITVEFDFQVSGCGGIAAGDFGDTYIINAAGDGYYIHTTARTEEWYQLVRTDGTVLINSTWSCDTNWHTCKVTRDGAGNWELFLDGNSKGTATDTTYTDFNRVRCRGAYGGHYYRWDDMKVY